MKNILIIITSLAIFLCGCVLFVAYNWLNISDFLNKNRDIFLVLSGALSALFARVILKAIYSAICRYKCIVNYPCYTSYTENEIKNKNKYKKDKENNPDTKKVEDKKGFLSHSWGEPFKETNKMVWKHTNVTLDDGASTIYGPYTNPFGKKGHYRICFVIKAEGYNKEAEICLIEVVKNILSYDNEKKELKHSGQSPLIQRILKGKNFKKRMLKGISKWTKFNLYIYHDGTPGTYEFRVLVKEFDFNENNNLYFDYVKVYESILFKEWFD